MSDIEHIQEQNIDILTIQNEIEHYIDLFCQEQNIDDVKNISQSVFNGLLMYVNMKYIKPSNVLKNGMKYGAYNLSICDKLCDYYIYICRIYDKECSVQGFVKLSGIDENTIYEWYSGAGKYKASSQRSDIYKRISKEREDSLSDKLLTGKNPVGVLGILNHFYGWSGVGNMTEDRTKQAASLTDASAGVLELCDNSAGIPEKLPD